MLVIDHRSSGRRHVDARQSRPRKVLHPRAVRRYGVDLLHLRPRLGRVPPIVKYHATAWMLCRPLLRELLHCTVTAVAVDDEDPTEAAVRHAVEDVAHNVQMCFDAK